MTKEVYDFYYSEKTMRMEKEMSSLYDPPLPLYRRYFKGLPYTELVKKGEKPISKWDDLVYIGSGTYDDVVIEKI